MVSAKITLLGPQRLAPTLRDAVAAAGVRGRLAVVTAGWEEREEEDEELSEHLGGRIVNLHLWGRAEEVYQRDPELMAAVRGRREILRRVQELYRIRLSHALEAARTLLTRKGTDGREEDPLLESERSSAIEDVRRLDAEHLERIEAAQSDFLRTWNPRERPQVARHREQLKGLLSDVEGLCIAGGDVRILLGRLRLFGLLDLWDERPIFAWSAGAMVLGPRIVLFHDSPPQGAGDAEIFEIGFARFKGLLPLPHARRRLSLDDRARVGLFARRFGPDLCVAFDERTGVRQGESGWVGDEGTMRLCPDGSLQEVGGA
jgi:hypothetical protein